MLTYSGQFLIRESIDDSMSAIAVVPGLLMR